MELCIEELTEKKAPTICLNMIVKNESKIIFRLLETVLPIIDTYCICDTGSTDMTKELIKEFFDVRCIEGKVLDVAVDIREGSETFGQHVTIELTGENKKQVFIPRGFAHGFLVLSESAIFAYKVDNSYAPTHDVGIRWDDSLLNIQWGVSESEVLVSEKDAKLPFFSEFETPFTN